MSDVWLNSMSHFLGPIMPLLEDESISEVMINGPASIWIERSGKIEKSDLSFKDEDSLVAAVNNIAQSVGRRIDDKNPRLDARLPNGYRIHAVVPPCARNGTTVAIRKFFKTQISFKQLIEKGSISRDGAQFLDICMKLGKNILVSGGTGSGKTTLLSVLCERIPKGQRIIVIEDSSELQINYEHVVFFETQMADAMGKGAVSMTDLLKSSLRLRPDRIIVGEVRGFEALDLIQAMNTGHKGCLGTIHANSPAAAMVRLEALAQGAESKMSEKALSQQVASSLDMVVQISRYPDGSRRINSIAEVRGFTPAGAYDVVPIFELPGLVKNQQGLTGELVATGERPSFLNEIQENGIPFLHEKFKAA